MHEPRRGSVGIENVADEVRQFRYVVRGLWRGRGFAVVAILSLGLGLGLSTMMFSVANAFLLRPVDVPDAEELVVLAAQRPDRPALANMSYPNYVDLQERSRVFAGLTAYTPLPAGVLGEGFEGRVWGQAVAGNYFHLLGVIAETGRILGPADDREGQAERVAVISHRLWRSAFRLDPGIVGRTVRFNGLPFVVAGVAREGFRGTHALFAADFWVSFRSVSSAGWMSLDNRRSVLFRVLGRLHPETPVSQAQADVDVHSAWLRERYPAENRELRTIVLPETAARPTVDAAGAMPTVAFVLMLVAGLVLVIAAANVSGLVLVRAADRRRAMVIQLALGATRFRVVRQVFFESVLVTCAGGALGLLTATVCGAALNGLVIPGEPPVRLDFRADGTVLAFGLILSMTTGVLIGMMPAASIPRLHVQGLLHGRRGDASGTRFRSMTVGGQFAMVTVLLAIAALFVRSASRAGDVDLGFQRSNTLLVALEPLSNGYDEIRSRRLFEDVLSGVRGLPGVEAASLAANVPLGPSSDSTEMHPTGEAPDASAVRVSYNAVSDDYFRTMRIPILRGRPLDERDRRGASGVVVVNELLANRFWPARDSVGRQVQVLGRNGSYDTFEVVGVARDGKYNSLGEAPRHYAYFSLAQRPHPRATVHVRSGDSAPPATAGVRSVLRGIDPYLLPVNVTTLDTVVQNAVFAVAGGGAALTGVFGAGSFGLAAVGLFGLMSYTVRLRTREVAIRMALGATTSEIVRLFVTWGLRITGVSLAVGLFLSIAFGKVVEGLLVNVSSPDWLSIGLVVLLVLGVTLIACYVPVRRLVGSSPTRELQHE